MLGVPGIAARAFGSRRPHRHQRVDDLAGVVRAEHLLPRVDGGRVHGRRCAEARVRARTDAERHRKHLDAGQGRDRHGRGRRNQSRRPAWPAASSGRWAPTGSTSSRSRWARQSAASASSSTAGTPIGRSVPARSRGRFEPERAFAADRGRRASMGSIGFPELLVIFVIALDRVRSAASAGDRKGAGPGDHRIQAGFDGTCRTGWSEEIEKDTAQPSTTATPGAAAPANPPQTAPASRNRSSPRDSGRPGDIWLPLQG